MKNQVKAEANFKTGDVLICIGSDPDFDILESRVGFAMVGKLFPVVGTLEGFQGKPYVTILSSEGNSFSCHSARFRLFDPENNFLEQITVEDLNREREKPGFHESLLVYYMNEGGMPVVIRRGSECPWSVKPPMLQQRLSRAQIAGVKRRQPQREIDKTPAENKTAKPSLSPLEMVGAFIIGLEIILAVVLVVWVALEAV